MKSVGMLSIRGAGCQVCLLQLGLSQGVGGGVGKRQVPGAPMGAESEADGWPSVAELNSRFPQLEITRLIGRGGMGAIYQARQTSLDRDVALKLIAKEVSQDPTFVERFEREAKTLAKLSHPNIVTIYDFWIHDRRCGLLDHGVRGRNQFAGGDAFAQRGAGRCFGCDSHDLSSPRVCAFSRCDPSRHQTGEHSVRRRWQFEGG